MKTDKVVVSSSLTLTKSDYEAKVILAKLWAKAYYVDNDPLATDEEYDLLMGRIKHYEKEHPNDIDPTSPTQTVGGISTSKEFKKDNHLKRMWSMEDIFTEDELRTWLDKVDTREYLIEPKFDGASLNLVYEGGFLQKAITRGDGTTGEVITKNAEVIAGIPLFIEYPGKLEVRGEVMMLKQTFERLNETRLANGETLFSNPRNAAAGTLRQLDSNIVKERKLTFLAWGVGYTDLHFKTQIQLMAFLTSIGFYQNHWAKVVSTRDEIIGMYHEFIRARPDISTALDGMVIKVNSVLKQEELGYTNKYPKWMVAFKFPAIEKVTKLLAVDAQVGRTGVITPVARIEPVDIDGVMVSNATLHNYSEIKRKDLRIGDSITIIRSGDVIPKIIKPLIERRNGTEQIVKPIEFCPICNSKLFQDTIITKCQNINCHHRVLYSLIHFASRGAMNIIGLGDKVLEALKEKNFVNTPKDIYHLTYDMLSQLESFQQKKIERLLKAIDDSRHVTLKKLIFALGIENVGDGAAGKIASIFKERWMDVTQTELSSIPGFGLDICDSYLGFMSTNRESILELLKELTIIYEPTVQTIESIFTGKSVVLTGAMFKPRDEIRKLFEKYGATVSNTVTKATDYLIYGENAGGKMTDAEKLGVKTMSIDEAILELRL